MFFRSATFITIALSLLAGLASAQSPDTFAARLSRMPVSLSELSLVGGNGDATATLNRSRLVINGRFDGLPAAATFARLHQGAATGARGPAIADLEVTHAADGVFSGEVELSREQRAALVAGHLYIQLYADPGVPPDNGVMRGWLLGFAEQSNSRRGE